MSTDQHNQCTCHNDLNMIETLARNRKETTKGFTHNKFKRKLNIHNTRQFRDTRNMHPQMKTRHRSNTRLSAVHKQRYPLAGTLVAHTKTRHFQNTAQHFQHSFGLENMKLLLSNVRHSFQNKTYSSGLQKVSVFAWKSKRNILRQRSLIYHIKGYE